MKSYYHDQLKEYQTEIVPISKLGGAAPLQCIARHIWPMQVQNNCTKITAKVKHKFNMEDKIDD